MKPFFSDKGVNTKGITLIEGDTIISDDTEVAEILNKYFKTAVEELDIEEPSEYLTDSSTENDPLDKIFVKYAHHPSIRKIEETIKKGKFSFDTISLEEVQTEINNLDCKKSNPSNCITAKNLKENVDICSEVLHNVITNGISCSIFDDNMKFADIKPCPKSNEDTNKKIYRPLSVLPAASKVYERIMHKQIGKYMDAFLSPYLCGYRKGYNAQYALLSLIEKWRISLDNHGYGGAILMDLSKAFDTINHELLLAKLNAYGFDRKAVLLIQSYLSNRWQRTKVNMSFSTWSELIQGVPQGSILGPILFNIYINDLFFIAIDSDICNFADDNTLHTCDISLKDMIERLECSASEVIQWFKHNHMKLNEDKCQLLIGGHKHEVIVGNLEGRQVIEKDKVKLLGAIIDRDLTFEDHVITIYKKASNKLKVLSRQCKVLPFHKRRVLMKAFFDSQFSYSPLVWMFHSRELNYKINNLHHRALQIVYRDDDSTFTELLKRDNSVSIHHRNLQRLAIEMFKIKNKLSPSIMTEIVNERVIPDNSVVLGIRGQTDFYNYNNPKSVYNGLETLRTLGPKIWNTVPQEIKNCNSIESFKHSIKSWIPSHCPCRLCKTYVQGMGFIDLIY